MTYFPITDSTAMAVRHSPGQNTLPTHPHLHTYIHVIPPTPPLTLPPPPPLTYGRSSSWRTTTTTEDAVAAIESGGEDLER